MTPLERPNDDASELAGTVEMVRVQILADTLIYEGFVALVGGARLQEELNDPKPFLNLTDAVIQDRSSASASHAPFVALNKGAVTHVVLLTAESESGEVKSADTTGLSAEAKALAAARPQVPPAGPRTLPGPPPAPRTRLNDPPTQPFPRLHAEGGVGDLILDDDVGDDIDPDDLERDVGALIAGASGAE
jgi:hypothetical protein